MDQFPQEPQDDMVDQKVYPVVVHPDESLNPNIFTDPQSPFATAPEKVKQILLSAKQDGRLNAVKIDLDKLGFELKPTGNNFCSHFFIPLTEQYHACGNCSLNSHFGMTMCYCNNCWEPQKHIGHNHYATTPSSDQAYCDCGRIQRFKKESICSNHSAYSTIKQCVIPQKQGTQFKQALQSLIQCAIYEQMDTTLFQKILIYLNKLNENSIFYNRLTFDVVAKPSKFISKQKIELLNNQNTFFIVLSKYDNENKFSKFLIHMGGDLLTRCKMVKYICDLYDKIGDSLLSDYINNTSLVQTINLTTIEKLLQENYMHKLFDVMIQNAPDKQSKKIAKKITSLKIRTFKSLAQLNQLNPENLSTNEAQKILSKIIQLYPSSQNIRKFIRGEQSQSQNPWAKFQLVQSKQQSYQGLQVDVKIANLWFLRLLSIIIRGDIQKISKIGELLSQLDIKQQKIDQILHWVVLGSKQICCLEEQPSKKVDTVIFLSLLKQSKNSKQLLKRFWNFLLKSQKSKQQSQKEESYTQIQYFVDIFHFVISTLFHSQISLLMEKTRIMKSEQGSAVKLESSSQEETLENWFRSFLYERKTISRQQILELKKQGFLEFKNAPKFLNQLCTFNQDDLMFTFSTSKVYKNIINQFPLKPIRENYASLYANTIHYGQQININGQLSKDLIQFVLKADNILPVFDKEWEKYLKSSSKNDGQHKYAYLYLFVLVIYDSLTNGENKQVRQRLEFLRNNKQLLVEFTNNQDQIQQIHRLLKIDKAQNKMQEKQQKTENNSEKKQKHDSKKKKITERFKKNRQLVLQRIKSTTSNASIEEQQQICILCHELQKEGNDMVYISSINKNNTICSAIHGKNNISNTYIYTCFHAIHLECFIKLQKNTDKSFNCPLCQIPSNCVVPMQFKKQKKRLNKICSNVMIGSMITIYGIYDVQNNFILIFKHLVESNGLNSLLESTRYEQKRKLWAKNDDFLEEMMKEIYENSGNDDKKQYLNSIDNFLNEISKCPDTPCRLIQQLFAQILKDIATRSQIKPNKKLLIQIRQLLEQDQFMVIKDQAERLIGQNGQIVQIQIQPPTQQQRSKSKTSLSFNLKRLPQNSKQCAKIFQQKCKTCQQSSQFFCLMCGTVYCSNCKDKHSSQAHNDTTIYLYVSNLRIDCIRRSYYSSDSVYYNPFKISYEEKDYYDDMADDDYLLSEIKYQKIVNKFLSN